MIKIFFSKSQVLRTSLFLLLLATSSLALAQEQRWTANVGGGFTPLVGGISNRLDNGWNMRVGGGYNVTPHFSMNLQFAFHGLGVSRAVLNEAQVPDGNAHVWSITAEPRLKLKPGTHGVSPYVVGAFGYYRRMVEFTRPTLAPVLIFDPIFGIFQGFVPANRVLGSITRNGVGGGAGAGLEIPLGSRSHNVKLFTEARFEYAATGAVPTRMVPLTFGIRW